MTAAASPTDTRLPRQQEQAAALFAAGGKLVDEIAAEVGVSRRTLWRWRDLPAFKARKAEIEAELDREAYASVYAKKRNRVTRLSDMAEHLERQIKASRKANPALVHQWRGLLEQIAREMGQWTDRLNMSVEGRVEQVQVREVLIKLDPQGDPELEQVVRDYLDGSGPSQPVEAAWREADQAVEETLAVESGWRVPEQPADPEPVEADTETVSREEQRRERKRLTEENNRRIQQAAFSRQRSAVD